MDQLTQSIAVYGLTAVGVVLLLVAAVEACLPREPGGGITLRWATNLTLYGATLLASSALPVFNFQSIFGSWDGLAALGFGRGGALAAAFIAGFVVLDLLTYLLHRMGHVAPFWRLHHVHHSDHELDASTGLRHHPGEAVINGLLGSIVTTALGVPLWIAPIYVITFDFASLLQHANLALPPRADRWLSHVVMTPGAHRIHHSAASEHFDKNFGAVLTIWDRIFNTWHDQVAHPLCYGVAGVPKQSPMTALVAPVLLR